MDPKEVRFYSKVDCNIRKSVTGLLEMEHLIYSIVKEINKLNRAYSHKIEQTEHDPFWGSY